MRKRLEIGRFSHLLGKGDGWRETRSSPSGKRGWVVGKSLIFVCYLLFLSLATVLRRVLRNQGHRLDTDRVGYQGQGEGM